MTRAFDYLYQSHDCLMLAMDRPPEPIDFKAITDFIINFLNLNPEGDPLFPFFTAEDPNWADLETSGTGADLFQTIRTKSGSYVICGVNNHLVLSSDGKHWGGVDQDSGLGSRDDIRGMAYKTSNNKIITVDQLGRTYSSTDNGVTWTAELDSARTPPWHLRYFAQAGEDRWVFPTSADVLVWSDDDFATQNEQTIDGGVNDWNDIGFNGSLWVVVGAAGRLYTSPDFTTWTARTSGASTELWAVQWSARLGIWVAQSSTEPIVSADGITWHDPRARVVVTDTPADLIWTGNNFWALQGRQIHRSLDGEHWINQFHEPTGQGRELNRIWISPGDDQFIFSGDDDAILTMGFRTEFADVL